jgi:hypothetical protein
LSKHYPCYWSDSRDCTKGLFEDVKDAFIIGSCAADREKFIEETKKIIAEVELNPIFAEDLKDNNNLDAFCDNICSHIRGSRIIINDISAPLLNICETCKTLTYNPSLNVYWEYGYAAGLGKPQIVICEQEQFDKIPFDVAGKQIQSYTKETLRETLKPLIENELSNPIPSLEIVKTKNLERILEKLPKIEQLFDDKPSVISSELEFQIKVIPKYLEDNLFEDNQYSDLKTILLKNKYGPSVVKIDYNYMFDRLRLSREGLYSIYNYPSEIFPMGGNIFIAKEGIIIFKWYYNQHRQNVPERRFPSYFISSFILGFLDFLHIIFSNFNYSEDLKIIFSIDNLRGWKYTHIRDELQVDHFYETNSDYFEPYEFDCNVNNLTSNNYKLELIKDKIMRQILLDMECEDEFRIPSEILKEYQPYNE